MQQLTFSHPAVGGAESQQMELETEDTRSESRTSTKEQSRTAPKALLSCELCRTRKVKCDKAWPSCSTCTRAGVKCVIVNRQRLPRGRNGGRRKVIDADLKARVGRLENLVKNLGADPNGSEAPVAMGLKQALESRHESFVRETQAKDCAGSSASDGNESGDMSKYLGSSFWIALSEEVSGLREVLDHSSDDEGDSHDQSSLGSDPPAIDFQTRDFGYIICGPDSFIIGPESLKHPPRDVVQILCSVYFSNVDPVCKILHRPSVQSFLMEGGPYLDHRPGDPAVEALCFSIYYSALISQTDIETRVQFGEDKHTLLGRFRFASQVSLARADLINTTSITTLQAFTVLLAAVRFHDSSRFSWTLVALAIRIAKALGLHKELSIANTRPFEREMRRRLWHQIYLLDHHAAFDRGTSPICLEERGAPPLPLNVNDDDISYDSVRPVKERDEFTDMTFNLMCFDASLLSRRLTLYYLDAELPNEDDMGFKARQEAVEAFKEHIETRYLRYCDVTKPFHWFSKTVGEIMVAGGTLFSVRPMKRTVQPLPPGIDRGGLLRLSIRVLELSEKLAREPNVRQWGWHLWIQWHALAVALAELCSQTEGSLVENAWKTVELSFERYAKLIADTNKGLLWRPMEKLRRTALRNRASQSPSSARSLFIKESPPDTELQMPLSTEQLLETPTSFTSSEPLAAPLPDFSAAQHITQPDAKSFGWWPTLFSNEGNATAPTFGNWMMPPTDITFANWDNFVEDFEDVIATPDPRSIIQR